MDLLRIAAAAALAAVLLLLPATAGNAKDRAVGPDPVGEAKLAKILNGWTAGKPVHCIDMRQIQSSEVIDGAAIVYRVGARTLYVNRTLDGQDQLDSSAMLVTKTYSTQLCRLDQVQLVDRTSRFMRGIVGLGDFIPYTKDKTPPKPVNQGAP